MKRSSQFAAFSFALLSLLAAPRVTSAQGFTADPAKAKDGSNIFKNKCAVCHSIGKGPGAGPDLLGVTDRREFGWIHSWLSDNSTMVASDTIALRLIAENHKMKMPNMKLSDEDIQKVLSYIALESAKKK